MKRYIGAIDQGTTSSRFILFDERGEIASVAQKEHEQIFPKPGWVEHDPIEIWRNTQEVIGAALAREGLHAPDVVAVGITNQRETTVIWDRRTGKPLHNALVWQDTRVADLATGLRTRRRPRSVPREDGFAARGLLQRPQAQMVARHRCRRSRESRGGRCAVRHGRFLVAVEPHGRPRRRRACDRRDECEPHAAHGSRDTRLGRRNPRDVRHSARRVAAHRVVERGLRHGCDRAAARRAHRGHPWRSASGARRSDVLCARRGEETRTARAASC